MKEQLIELETAKLAKEVGFNVLCLNLHGEDLGYMGVHKVDNCNQMNAKDQFSAPTQSLLQKWLREEKKMEVTVVPVFRDKCGYDSFKRDGYAFDIMQIEPCQFLTWADFNRCAEDRDEEQKEYPEDEWCLSPSVSTYEQALEAGLVEGLKLVNKNK